MSCESPVYMTVSVMSPRSVRFAVYRLPAGPATVPSSVDVNRRE